ncbi:MAG: chorismate mutase, partial [Coriobacteriales bacterium]
MELDEIRKQIDETDEQLLEIFLKRMDLSRQVAETKKESEKPVLDKTREREILKRVREESGDLER